MHPAAMRRRLLQHAAANATAAVPAGPPGPPMGAAAAAGGYTRPGGGGGGGAGAAGGGGVNASDAVRNVIDDGEDDLAEDFTDMETVILTCITTLVTLVFALIAGFCVRLLWRKLRERSTAPGYEGVLQREESSDPLAARALSASGDLLADEVRLEAGAAATKTTTTKFSASASPHQNGVFVVEVQQGGVAAAPGPGPVQALGAGAGAGPGVAAAHAPSAALYPRHTAGAAGGGGGGGGVQGGPQTAQVHRPPDIEIDDTDDIAHIDDDEDEEAEGGGGKGPGSARFGSTNTGLSQSDLSMSSAGSNNPSYRYGNQVGYESGQFGYPQYSGYSASAEWAPLADEASGAAPAAAPAHAPAPTPAHAPALGAQRAVSVDNTLAYGPLMSDSQAVQRRKDEVEEDIHQEEQRKLGNGSALGSEGGGDADPEPTPGALPRKGSLPPRLPPGPAPAAGEHLVAVAEADAPAAAAAAATPGDAPADDAAASRGKRASLPIITPDLYAHTKSLLLDKSRPRAGLSPKFERLRNQASPLEEVEASAAADADDTEAAAAPAAAPEPNQYTNQAFVATDQASS